MAMICVCIYLHEPTFTCVYPNVRVKMYVYGKPGLQRVLTHTTEFCSCSGPCWMASITKMQHSDGIQTTSHQLNTWISLISVSILRGKLLLGANNQTDRPDLPLRSPTAIRIL